MQEEKLYLAFEFLSMDLKKYLDSLPKDEFLDIMLVKSYLFQVFAPSFFCQRCLLTKALRYCRPYSFAIEEEFFTGI